ncbi:MAG: endolytic transglycosylase MltG [Ginsengibacter sp.]
MRKPVVIFIFIAILLFGFTAWELFGPSAENDKTKYFYIPTGSDYSEVRKELTQQHILKSTFFFDQLAKYSGYHNKVKPGKYKVTGGMSVFNLLRMLRSGRQSPVNLVISKLRTKEDFAKKLGDNFEFDSTTASKFLYSKDSLSKYDLDSNTVLTAVIPNTYTMQWNTSMGKVFNKLYTQEMKFWNNDRKQKAKQQNLSPTQAYILASIVEEETNKASDKSKIASVYLNRLNANMKLAADPTVRYAMRDFSLKRIYNKYLSYPSDYNTYQNKGLPPGPICTPSIKTIDAVLDAPKTSYLFFVAKADFSGYSNFASSYQEHEIYAKQYQAALDSLIRAKAQTSN